MKKSFAALVALLSVSSVYAMPMPKGDAAAGQALSAQCAACHGADGNSAAPTFPRLAGQNAKYIYKQLNDFKSGLRNNALMMPMVADKTDQQMADLAVYFSQQKSAVNLADPALLAKGERLYRGGNPATGVAPCAGCHGPSGRDDNTDQKRVNDAAKAGEQGIMQMVASKLSDKEIDALANYVSGLH